MFMFRRIGAIVLAVAAIGVWFGMAPNTGSNSSSGAYQAAIASALAADATNASSAQSAPQQQVVNGWTARDLLAVIAKEGATTASVADQRPAALLVLAVLGIALLLITGGPSKDPTVDAASVSVPSSAGAPALNDLPSPPQGSQPPLA